METLKDIFRFLSKTDKRLLVSFSISSVVFAFQHTGLKHLKPWTKRFELSVEFSREAKSGNVLVCEEQA